MRRLSMLYLVLDVCVCDDLVPDNNKKMAKRKYHHSAILVRFLVDYLFCHFPRSPSPDLLAMTPIYQCRSFVSITTII